MLQLRSLLSVMATSIIVCSAPAIVMIFPLVAHAQMRSLFPLAQQGLTALQARRYRDAEAIWRQILKHDPNNAHAHFYLGVSLSQQRKTQEAVAAYRRLLQLDPNNHQGYSLLAAELKKQGNYEGAISTLQQAIRLAPRNPRYQALLKQWQGESMLRIFSQPPTSVQTPASNPGLDTSISTSIRLYTAVSRNLQQAERNFQTCRLTSSSPMSCSSTAVVSYRASMIGHQNTVIRLLMSAKKKTVTNPRLCPQTTNAYQQALAAGISVAGAAEVREFCRNRGMRG